MPRLIAHAQEVLRRIAQRKKAAAGERLEDGRADKFFRKVGGPEAPLADVEIPHPVEGIPGGRQRARGEREVAAVFHGFLQEKQKLLGHAAHPGGEDDRGPEGAADDVPFFLRLAAEDDVARARHLDDARAPDAEGEGGEGLYVVKAVNGRIGVEKLLKERKLRAGERSHGRVAAPMGDGLVNADGLEIAVPDGGLEAGEPAGDSLGHGQARGGENDIRRVGFVKVAHLAQVVAQLGVVRFRRVVVRRADRSGRRGRQGGAQGRRKADGARRQGKENISTPHDVCLTLLARQSVRQPRHFAGREGPAAPPPMRQEKH